MIEIDIGSYIASTGAIAMSWHGFFSFVAVAMAVYLVGRWAPMRGVRSDAIYAIAVWAIIGGVIGARLVHVIDEFSFYQANPGRILAVWSGGIGLWGGILGGFAGGIVSAFLMNIVRRNKRPGLERAIRNLETSGTSTEQDLHKLENLREELDRNEHLPLGLIADITAPAMLFVQTIGRIGDIINGEHCAVATSFPLGFVWTNPLSDSRFCSAGTEIAVQPVIAYEMIWNTIALVVVWKLLGKLSPNGMVFALYLVLYSIGRFAISFARQDDVWIAGLQEAHFIALFTLLITVPLLAIKARFQIPTDTGGDATSFLHRRFTRAERRRKSKGV